MDAPPPAKGRTYVWGGVAVAVALGVGLVAVLSSGPKHPPMTAVAPTVAPTPTAVPTVEVVKATPTATATATATPVVEPLVRVVRVESEPSGASVNEGDTEVCTKTPCELMWKDDAAKAEHKLQINKRGYRTYKVTVGAKDEKISAKLDVIPITAPPPPPPPPPPAGAHPLYKDVYKKDI